MVWFNQTDPCRVMHLSPLPSVCNGTCWCLWDVTNLTKSFRMECAICFYVTSWQKSWWKFNQQLQLGHLASGKCHLKNNGKSFKLNNIYKFKQRDWRLSSRAAWLTNKYAEKALWDFDREKENQDEWRIDQVTHRARTHTHQHNRLFL